MEDLSIDCINESAPYMVKGSGNMFRFYSDEGGDGKQSMRSRLFEYWFNTYKRKAQFTLLTTSIVDDEGIVNFATLIIRNDNPNFLDILSEFSESVNLLSQKPES